MDTGTELGAEEQFPIQLGYEPSLDGLRGISILAVMGFNAHLTWLRGGFVGVDIFFVLSGFLITTLLVQEHRQTSAIRLKEFYARRATRLLPALFVLILFCIAYALLFQETANASLTFNGVLYTLLYVANWAQIPPNPPGIGALSHAWSLSVEEQFYIVWPIVLILLLKLKARELILAILAFLIGISIFLNVYLSYIETPYLRMYFGTDARANEILIGCAVALLLCWGLLQRTELLKKILQTGALASLALLAFAFFSFRHWDGFVYNGGFVLISIATAILIADLLLFPSWISRCFEFGPLVWIGKISYGLYLWHYPIFEATRKLFEGKVNPVMFSVAGVVFTLVAATVSYYLLERPLLKHFRRSNVQGGNAQLIVRSAPTA